MTHTNKCSDDWEQANWTKFCQVTFRLQKRIFKAVRKGDMALARRLQKLILNSYSARMLSIRQVTQLNQGKKTAGIDGKKALTFAERFRLEVTLRKHYRDWKHQGLREIPIPKKDGSKRILKVPTISDRAWQCLVKYALEPAHEATFHARSYGFRPGRSAHDAQKILFNNLRSSCNGIDKRVIELDIEKCFDRISHNAILTRLIAPQFISTGLSRCLKAGVDPKFPEQGTPQGGVASPLLANIALNGIEAIGQIRSRGGWQSCCIRYADDMIFLLKPDDDATQLLKQIEKFLAERGMNVSQKKTKVTTTTNGFDFLGWHFQVQKNGKFRSTPSADNFKRFRDKVKHIVNNSNYGAETKASKLAPVVRGWRNYHKYCKMNGSKFNLWSLNERTRQVFIRQKTINKHQAVELVKIAFPAIRYSENKFVSVRGDKSPFDGDIIYWSKRKNLLYHGYTAKALQKQKHICGHCGLHFVDDERVELHHINGKHNDWDRNNLLAVHRSCHHYIHMSNSWKN